MQLGKWFNLVIAIFLTLVGLVGCGLEEQVTVTPTVTQQVIDVVPTNAPIPTSTPTRINTPPTQTSAPTVVPPTPIPPTFTPLPTPTRPITLPGPINPSQIIYQAGGQMKAVEVADNIAYVGVGPRLYTLDVSDPANIQVLGASGMLPGIIESLIYDDGVVYAATGLAGVWLIDVSLPDNPTPLASIPAVLEQQKLLLYNNYLLVVDQNYGYPDEGVAEFRLFDLSSKQNPVERFREDLPDVVSSIAYYDQYIYFAVGENSVNSEPGLLIFDATNLPEMETAAFLPDFPYAEHILIDTGILYHSGWSGIISYDLSDPSNPIELQEYGSFLPFDTDIEITENAVLAIEVYCDVGTCGSSLGIYPLNLPANQKEVYKTDTGFFAYDLAVGGDYAYVAAGSQLFIIDLSNISIPRLVDTWSGYGSAELLYVDEGLLYALNGDEYIFANYTLETADRPSFLRSQQFPYFASINSMAFSSDYAFWAGYWYGIVIAEKTQLDPIASVQNPSFYEQNASNVLYNQSNLLFALANNQLVFIDITEPTQPILVFPEEWQPNTEGSYKTIFWQEPYLYTAEGGGRLAALDVSNPSDPVAIGSLETGKTICDSTVTQDFMYVLAGMCDQYQSNPGELMIVDVSEPANIRVISTISVPGVMLDVAVGENYAFIANGDVVVVDIQDAAQPRLLDVIGTPGNASNLLVFEDLVYAADGEGGVLVIAMPENEG